MAINILRIDASARNSGSVTRRLNDQVIDTLSQDGPANVTRRDLTDALPQINETWVGANFTAPDERTEEQKQALALVRHCWWASCATPMSWSLACRSTTSRFPPVSRPGSTRSCASVKPFSTASMAPKVF